MALDCRHHSDGSSKWRLPTIWVSIGVVSGSLRPAGFTGACCLRCCEVNLIRDNPLAAMKMADDEFKAAAGKHEGALIPFGP